MKPSTRFVLWLLTPHTIRLPRLTVFWYFTNTAFILELRTAKYVREFAVKYERWDIKEP